MPEAMNRTPPTPPLSATWLGRAGLRAWLAIGVFVVVAAVFSLVGTLSAVVGPLTVAALLAVLFVPVVDRLQGVRVPRAAGSVAVLVALVAVAGWSTWLTVTAVADQGPEIAGALASAFSALDRWLAGLGADEATPPGLADGLQEALRESVGGLASWLSGALGGAVSGVWAVVIGSVVGAFFLFYLLSDWHGVVRWVGGRLPSRDVPGHELVSAAVDAVRRYFVGVTLSAVATVVMISTTAILLGIELWLTIAVVTFVTSFVPYLGAVVSGAFATLIALGTEGSDAAIVMLVVILLVQNVLQTVVLTNLTSSQLHLHPIVTLASTLVGGSLAGILGATLAAPVVATTITIRGLVAAARAQAKDGDGDRDGDGEATPPPA